MEKKERRSSSCLDVWKLESRSGRHQEGLDRRFFGGAHVDGYRSNDRYGRRRGNRLARGFVNGVVCVIVVVVVGVSCW